MYQNEIDISRKGKWRFLELHRHVGIFKFVEISRKWILCFLELHTHVRIYKFVYCIGTHGMSIMS